MRFNMLGDANDPGPVRLSDVYSSAVGDASSGIAASQKALYDAYSSLNSSKFDKTGGEVSGQISYKHPTIDLTKADNNVPSTTWPTTANYLDKNGNIMARLESVIEPSGRIGTYWYCRNYNTGGDVVGQKGIAMYMDKSGNLTYSISDPVNFLSAATQTVAWAGRAGYSNTSYTHETAIKNFIDTKIPATGTIKLCLVEITCGSSKIYIVQKYGQHTYASYIGMGYDGSLVIGKKQNGTWSAQKTVSTC